MSRVLIVEGDGDPRHGTYSGYNHHRCRCSACRRAAADRQRRIVRSRNGLPPDDPRHGRVSTYANWRCSCDLCCDAWRTYHASKRQPAQSRRTRTGQWVAS